MNSIINLLLLEWKKFKNNSVFNLFSVMFLLTFPTVIFIGKEWKNVPKPLPDNSIFFQFPTVWEWLAYEGSWLVFFFLGFIVMNMITSEIGYKTMRQNIITGMTRKEYFLGKVSVVVVISLSATLLYLLVGYVIGFFHNEPYSFEGAFEEKWWPLRYFLMCMSYLSFGLLLAFIIRRSGITIFAYVSYIFFLEPLLKWGIHNKIHSSPAVNFWPMNVTEDLAPFPPSKYAENTPMSLDFDFLLNPTHAMIAASVYICLFLGLAYWHFSKNDI